MKHNKASAGLAFVDFKRFCVGGGKNGECVCYTKMPPPLLKKKKIERIKKKRKEEEDNIIVTLKV